MLNKNLSGDNTDFKQAKKGDYIGNTWIERYSNVSLRNHKIYINISNIDLICLQHFPTQNHDQAILFEAVIPDTRKLSMSVTSCPDILVHLHL